MSYRKIEDGVKEECIRLRVEEGWSIKRIKKETGVAQGTLSRLLKDYPLSEVEIKRRHREYCRGRRESTKLKRGKYFEMESKFHKVGSGLDRNQIGRISEAAILFRLFLHGYRVFGAVTEGERSDWIASKNGKMLKIQVKTASLREYGSDYATCSVTGGNSIPYRDGDFDFFVAYDFFIDEAYVYSWEEVKGKTLLTVDSSARENWSKME